MNLNITRPVLLLATWQGRPDGENGGDELLNAFEERGIDARWAVWDDPAVDWARADAVAIRSAWDYHERLPEFLRWTHGTAASTRLFNGADAVVWSADKAYLFDLARAGVPIVPTMQLHRERTVLAEALARWGPVVVKPRVGAGGSGVTLLTGSEQDPAGSEQDPAGSEQDPAGSEQDPAGAVQGAAEAGAYDDGGWLAQPHVHSVHSLGESSVFVFGGIPSTQVDKAASRRAVALDDERARVAAAAVAAAAVAAAEDRLGRVPDYARVDLLNWEGRWCVSELELIEPSLYLDVEPLNARHFAALVRERIA